MKILLLSPWLPWPPYDGARIRIFETIRHLSSRHRVTLLAPVRQQEEADNASPLNDLCESIITIVSSDQGRVVLRRLVLGTLHRMPLIESFHYHRNLAGMLQKLTSHDTYDIVHVEFPFLVPYLRSIHSRSRARKVLSMHNIESLRFERELHCLPRNPRRLLIHWDRFFFAAWEQEAIRQFDGIIVVSGVDEAWIQHYAPGVPVEIVPNGVDAQYFSPVQPSKAVPSLVFTGLMDYPPNVDAVLWFCDEILPSLRHKIPDLLFNIVGSRPHPRVIELGEREGVQVTGEVADVRPYLAQCAAVVVPLRSGGGTRLKIFQAMAMERPVVSTSLGAEGIEVTPGENILIADDPDEFADHILWLIASPEAATRLGKGGRLLVDPKYDWQICLRGIDNLYGKLATGEVPRRASDMPRPNGVQGA